MNQPAITLDLTADEAVSFQSGMKLKEIEKAVILQTLKQQSYNRTRTAKVLGIGIRTLQRKLKLYSACESHEESAVEVVQASL